MKQIWPNYSYSPTTNVLTLTGLNIDRDQLLLVTAADRGRIMYNFADSSVTASAFTSGANTALTLVATTAGLTTTAALVIYYDDQLASTTVTVSSLPAISGTVTANVLGASNIPLQVAYSDEAFVDGRRLAVSIVNSVGEEYTTPLPISGTINSNILVYNAQTDDPKEVRGYSNGGIGVCLEVCGPSNNSVTIGGMPAVPVFGTVTANPTGTQTISGSVTLGAGTAQIGSVTVGNSVTIGSLPAISGTVTANGLAIGGTVANVFPIGVDTLFSGVRTVTDLAGYRLPISLGDSSAVVSASLSDPLPAGTNLIGSVTANSSNGSLTTRFGSVVTANTAFETSAVTNANRKYLLIQNITTASNVITVGIGFTPTTTQGIQLFSGAGLTFEGSYIPTGAVNLLSSATASCFTILEA
jgi:hypothetical protein